MSSSDVLEGTATEVGQEIEPAAHAPSSSVGLFRTDDPVEIIEQAGKVANALKGILTKQGLTKNISGRDHVLVEGWTTLGSMLGVFAVKEWVREVPWPDPVPEALKQQHARGLAFGYEASYEARRADSAVLGGAEADCKRTERSWAGRDDYALRSMAQTRATSKALRVPLGWIVTLAGYEATPEPEMPHTEPAAPAPVGPLVGADTAAQLIAAIGQALAEKRVNSGELPAMFAAVGAHPAAINAQAVGDLTQEQAQRLLDALGAIASGPDPTSAE